MNMLSIIVTAVLATLGQPQQPDKPGTATNSSTIIFEKSLSPNKKLIVTCEALPLVLTPKEEAARAEIKRTTPGIVLSDHLYAYSYVTVSKGGQRSVLWTYQQQTIGGIRPGKADDMSPSVEVLDIALQGNRLYVLYNAGRATEVNIVRLNGGRTTTSSSPGSASSSKQNQATAGRDVVQSPPGVGRIVEVASSLDAVASGRIMEPILNEEVTVQLSHVVKQQDGSTRVTTYHLGRDSQGGEFWMPEASNIYGTGEKPGIKLAKHQP